MKRVLFLAYLFPPIANSGTQRPMKFAKYLAEQGWEPIVVTAAHFDGHATDAGLVGEIPGVRVIRVPMLNERLGELITTMLGGGALARKAGDGVRWHLQDRRRVPDLFAWWQPTAVRAASRIFREIGFDAIYATGYPWTTLMVGAAVATATARPLIADFRDLWSGESLFRHERPPHEQELALERAVLESATTVVCATDTMTRMMSNAHPSVDTEKFVTIHNGFDPADMSVPRSRESSRFRIAYTGVWKDGYNPADLYNSIDWLRRSQPGILDDVEVIAAGFKPGEARRRGLTRCIQEIGVVPHHEAVALMRSADLLYLSHVDTARHWSVPGKLYEYLASGTPVLALTDPANEAGRIIRKVGGGVAISPDDPGNLYHALLDACRRKTFVTPPRNAEALRVFERRHLTARLAGILNEVSSRRAVPALARRMTYSAPAVPRLKPR